ncbi:MAG: M13 family metallopeptidase [Prevotella sp.]|nr:M13 family metallopeptidase [Prevotella sp.]
MKKSFILLVLACSFVGASAQTGKGYDRANMNLSVNPGDDFVEYATGTFIKNNPLRPDQTSNGSFVDLYELNQKQINELILQFANNPQEKGSLGQKIGTLYNQMMDSVGRDKKGYEPIKPLLERVRAIKDRKEYVRVCSDIDRKGGSTLMLGLGVGADMRQADMNIVSIGQAGLGLGTRDYYLNDDPQTTAIREAYKQCGKSFFMLVGYDEATAQKKMDAVYAIEKRLAEPWYSQVKLRDINANYHKMSFQELVRDFPGIDWTTVFWISGFPAFDYVDVGQPEPIHEVEKIYADTPLEDLKSYAELNVISHAAGLLSADFRKVQFTFRKVISGQQQDDPMWKRATNLVNSVMGEPIGKMYCEKYFPESSKNRMLQLVHNLQTALSQRIDEATWMSAETKAQAKDKLENFIVKIGYPDKWKDFTNLEISDTLSLTENLDNVSEFFLLDNLRKKVNKPVDKSEWFMTPQTINAYYNPTSNEICFPAGILQPPFFDPEADDALNYGAIGGVIGHEMSHGFDDQGCQFDKTGNQRNWWTEQDKKNFDQRTQVLVDHFSNIEVVNGKKVNGKLTLGENIGDNGGLNIALRAMRNTGNTAVIDGFTADQRFFLGWARVWAGTSRPEYQEMLITVDPHSPEFARVNGALPMIDEWYTAFNIKKGKLFVPKKKRAHIW